MGERAAYLCEQVGEDTLADLVRLRAQWSQAEADGEELAARMHRWWARQGDRRRAWVVRDADGVAVAMGNLAIFERMPKPNTLDGRWGYVGNVYVDPAHRRRGVASLLMTTVVEWARAEQLERIVLNPSEMSVPLYRSLGFRPADDLMRLDLDSS